MFRRKKKASFQVPSFEIPSMELGGGRLPSLRTPELRTPEFELPRFDLPSVQLGGMRLPHLETPELRTPRLDLELMTSSPFLRRRRANPIVQSLKFVLGLGVGLAVGCLVAALVAPVAGDDARRKLRELVKGGGEASGEGTVIGLPIASGAVRPGVAGLLTNPRGRFQAAMEEARRERESRERQLLAEFQTAKRTGSAPT